MSGFVQGSQIYLEASSKLETTALPQVTLDVMILCKFSNLGGLEQV